MLTLRGRGYDSRITCVAILLLLTLALLFACIFQNDLRPPLFFLALSAVVSAVLAGMQLGKERISTAGLHLFGVWLMLGLAPLLEYRVGLLDQHFANYHFFPFLPTTEELILASTAVLLWNVIFIFGYRIKVEGAVKWVKAHNFRIGHVAIFTQSLFGFIALAYIYDQVGFGALTRRDFESFSYESPGEFTFFTSTVRSVPFIALLALTIVLRDGVLRGARKVTAVLLVIALFMGNVLINNPFAAPRFLTGTVLLAFAFVLYFHKARTGLVFLLLALVASFVMFQLLDVGRLADNLHMAIDEAPVLFDRLFAGDPYRTFEAIPAALRYLDQNGSTYGFQLLGPLLFWVPRSFWPNKPEGSGTMLAGTLGGFHDNISCPMPCEALLNFGWLGIPMLGILSAMVLRIVDSVSRPAASSDPHAKRIRLTDLVYPLLLGQTFFITRGDFLSPWAFTVGMVIGIAPMAIAEAVSRLTTQLRPIRTS